ncbi:hypothetical protein MA16_Dca006703 [Dendrobium catenatum]|uniref:Uncharacterized protein n=1 Tax=Dendrobium catenatum TaxID=906689 RepID=A0A2I0W8Y3_9ASPA|nr:hypothetical protein MA16_Dca006703 [Dendrobium catenatum]
MAGGKRVRQTSWCSSRAKIDPHFREAEDEAAYHRYKECGITVFRIINPAHIPYPVMDLFAHTSLCFILSLAFPFNTEFLQEFFANLRINPTHLHHLHLMIRVLRYFSLCFSAICFLFYVVCLLVFVYCDVFFCIWTLFL